LILDQPSIALKTKKKEKIAIKQQEKSSPDSNGQYHVAVPLARAMDRPGSAQKPPSVPSPHN